MNEAEEEEIKKCWFCGSKSTGVFSFTRPEKENVCFVECQDCGARGPVATVGLHFTAVRTLYDGNATAIELWNKPSTKEIR